MTVADLSSGQSIEFLRMNGRVLRSPGSGMGRSGRPRSGVQGLRGTPQRRSAIRATNRPKWWSASWGPGLASGWY